MIEKSWDYQATIDFEGADDLYEGLKQLTDPTLQAESLWFRRPWSVRLFSRPWRPFHGWLHVTGGVLAETMEFEELPTCPPSAELRVDWAGVQPRPVIRWWYRLRRWMDGR